MIVAKDEFMLPPVADLKIDMWRNQPSLSQEIVDWLWIEDWIRIAGIAGGIREQPTDSQLFVWRPANVGNRSAVSILIVRAGVVGVEPACADRIIEVVNLALALQRFAKGAVGPALTAQHDCRLSFALFRENLDGTG